jgi:2-polyprenyl-6-methoxyphenol hydroxylase-like FAD-dependent oxidoreductase
MNGTATSRATFTNGSATTVNGTKNGVGPDGIATPKSSGIKVIIVGLGYAGCVAAIECHRKGHEVVVYEQAPQITNIGTSPSLPQLYPHYETNLTGDVIGITANAAQIISKWGNGSVHEELQEILSDYEMLNLHTHTGERLLSHTMLGYSHGSGYAANRGDMAVIFYKHALSLGIQIHLGQRITEYFETETEAGIVVNGEKVTADCVLACDGVHSKARGFIIGHTGAPHATGYAVYRAWFNGKEARENPKTKWITEGNRDKMEVYIGPNVHCIVGTGRRCQDVVWTCTHLVPMPSIHANARIHTISQSPGRSPEKSKMHLKLLKAGIKDHGISSQ